MATQPLPELGINPVDDCHADSVLIEQRWRQPQQRLVVKNPIAQIPNLIQRRRDRVALPLRFRTAGKHQTQVFPENLLELLIEERAPEAQG